MGYQLFSIKSLTMAAESNKISRFNILIFNYFKLPNKNHSFCKEHSDKSKAFLDQLDLAAWLTWQV